MTVGTRGPGLSLAQASVSLSVSLSERAFDSEADRCHHGMEMKSLRCSYLGACVFMQERSVVLVVLPCLDRSGGLGPDLHFVESHTTDQTDHSRFPLLETEAQYQQRPHAHGDSECVHDPRSFEGFSFGAFSQQSFCELQSPTALFRSGAWCCSQFTRCERGSRWPDDHRDQSDGCSRRTDHEPWLHFPLVTGTGDKKCQRALSDGCSCGKHHPAPVPLVGRGGFCIEYGLNPGRAS